MLQASNILHTYVVPTLPKWPAAQQFQRCESSQSGLDRYAPAAELVPASPPRPGSFASRWKILVKKLDDSWRVQSRVIPETDPARILARHEHLNEILSSKGLPFRFDSHLSAAWSKGVVKLSAEEVAQVMEGMLYLNEHSENFRRVCQEISKDIDDTVNRLAQERNGYHKGIYGDAVEMVYGNKCRNMSAIKRHLSGNWPDWPDEWPWLVEGREQKGDQAKEEAPSEI